MTALFDVELPHVNVLGSTMAYREAGNPEAPVVLFLHGNPTSSYIDRRNRRGPCCDRYRDRARRSTTPTSGVQAIQRDDNGSSGEGKPWALNSAIAARPRCIG
jgi:hypothetical protein